MMVWEMPVEVAVVLVTGIIVSAVCSFVTLIKVSRLVAE